MPRNTTRFVGLCAAFSVSAPALGQAGGIYLAEQGGPINGTAQAGQAAIARDAQTAFLNPAGLTRIKGGQFMSTIQPFLLVQEFDSGSGTTTTGGDGGDAGNLFLGGSLYLAQQLGDYTTFGFSITAPAGLGLDYGKSWAGSSWVTETEILVLNIEPSIGIKLDDQWSIGGGLDVQYAEFDLSLSNPLPGSSTATIDGDSLEVGVTLGALYEVSETTRFGARYRSAMGHELQGDLNVLAVRDVSTSFDLPQSLTFSAYHELNDRLAIMGDIGWTDWSEFDRNIVTIDIGSGLTAELPRDWDDVWNFGVGVHFRASDDWLLMAGASYVTSPVDDDKRTPDLPVDEQIKFSIGAERTVSERLSFGVNYTVAWLGDNNIDEVSNASGTLEGDYNAWLHVIGLYGVWNF